MAAGDVLATKTLEAAAVGALCWRSDGYLYAIRNDFNSSTFLYEPKIIRIDPATGGTLVTVGSIATQGTQGTGLAWDGASWYVTNDSAFIYKYGATGGSPTTQVGVANANNLSGIFWDGTYLWTVDRFDDLIRKVTTSGSVVTSFASGGLNSYGIVRAGDHLWHVDIDSDQLYEMTLAGALESQRASQGGNTLAWDGANFWHSNGTSLYQLEGPVYNTAPNAPIITAPADGSTFDRTSTQRFSLTPSDPDPGDSTSETQWRYRLIGAATWTTVIQSLPQTYIDFAAGTFAAGDYELQAATRDAQGLLGPFCTSVFFTAATPAAGPTITSPLNGATVGTSAAAVEWSAPAQEQAQVRKVADNAGTPDTTIVYSDTLYTDSATRQHLLSFSVNNRYEHIQVRIMVDGLWSAWSSVRVLVSYTPPPQPVVTLTPNESAGSILVGVTNPAPGTGEPALAYNDIYVDDGDGEERRVTGVLANGTWLYHLPVSGRDYDGSVRVTAVATNGTTAST